MQFLAPSIFLNRIHQIHKENVKGNSCLMFFFNLCRYILTFSWKRKKKRIHWPRLVVAVGQGHALATNLSFSLKTLLFIRVSSVLIFHTIFYWSTSKIIPKSRQLSLNSSLNYRISSYSTMNVLIILSPFRSSTLVATHSLCLSRE